MLCVWNARRRRWQITTTMLICSHYANSSHSIFYLTTTARTIVPLPHAPRTATNCLIDRRYRFETTAIDCSNYFSNVSAMAGIRPIAPTALALCAIGAHTCHTHTTLSGPKNPFCVCSATHKNHRPFTGFRCAAY